MKCYKMNVMDHYEKMGYCPSCKSKEVLKILIEYRVNLLIFIGSDTMEEYNRHPLTYWKLTEEKYKLLKEVIK